MKGRIIDTLVSLSKGENNPVRKILEKENPRLNITLQSSKALKNILHDYSSFSVSTIDSFFQRILRSLAREIHLPLNMEVQVEIDDAVLEVTDQLLREVGIDQELTDWITRLALQKLDEDKGWSLERDIENVARQLFKEDRDGKNVLTREQIHAYYEKLIAFKAAFEKDLRKMAAEVVESMKSNGLSVPDFNRGATGFAAFFGKLMNPKGSDYFIPGKTVLSAAEDAEYWASKTSRNRAAIISFANSGALKKLNEILSYIETNKREYFTATEILKKINLFGIINDLQRKLSEYRNVNNVILLSDTTRLLSDVIHENDTPFIYEQTGNRFKHLLIDEFQDTSILQWKNLLPLIINTLGSGNMALVVGDAKQSIYRWRGGNMNLLLSKIFTDLGRFNELFKVEQLAMNYRSRLNIVEFNNSFFTNAPEIVNADLSLSGFSPLSLAYSSDLKQQTVENNLSGGYVKIKFVPTEKDDEGNGWKLKAQYELTETITSLLASGYSYRDICILVRKNTEGNEIAGYLYENGIEEVISADSLLIAASPKIQFLIHIIRFLNNNNDTIARSEIIYYYSRYLKPGNDTDWHSVFSDHHKRDKRQEKKSATEKLFEGLEDNVFNRILPERFTSNLSYLAKLPLYELVEQLISIFGLNQKPDAYIQCFQDLILECSVKINSSLDGFIQWWDSAKKAKDASVNVPENKDAIRIMTIHSSKGLQFPIVIIPYAEWKLKPKANETLWVKSEGSRFDEIGEIAVNTSAKLKETYFQKDYENEVSNTVVDNLNLLYVAFTRAEEKLFVFAPADNETELNSVSKLIFRTCMQLNPSFDKETFETGQEDFRSENKAKEIKIIPEFLQTYPSNRWQERLSLSSHAADLTELIDKQISRINYGILVHSILAAIAKTDEIDSAIEGIVFEGLISAGDKIKLKEEIRQILSVSEISELFDSSYTVMAEREIILPTGETLRPDRVIVKDNSAIVIDFKTGKREKKHQKQVKDYAEVLKKMKYTNVSSKLVYLAERAVEEV